MPETLMPEQIEGLAVDEIDLLLSNDDLACPHCGCHEFSTMQRGDATQCVIRGEWRSLEMPVETLTVEVACDDCGVVLWGAKDA